jgi:hypothetical protein
MNLRGGYLAEAAKRRRRAIPVNERGVVGGDENRSSMFLYFLTAFIYFLTATAWFVHLDQRGIVGVTMPIPFLEIPGWPFFPFFTLSALSARMCRAR